MDFRDFVTDEIRREQMLRHWVDVYPSDPFPEAAIKAGYDQYGTELYVGRCFHRGCVLPANVKPKKSTAFIAWGKKYHKKSYYQVLVGDCFNWVPIKREGPYQQLPIKGVRSGEISCGEPVYVGRGLHENCLLVGNVLPSRCCLFIPFNGTELRLNEFELLVKEDLIL